MRLADYGARRYVRASIKPKLVSSTSTSLLVVCSQPQGRGRFQGRLAPSLIRFDSINGEKISFWMECVQCVCVPLFKKKNELRNDRGPGQQRAPVAALAIVFYILLPSRFFSPAVTALLHARSPEARHTLNLNSSYSLSSLLLDDRRISLGN